MRVLVVEDDVLMGQALYLTLVKQNYAVDVAHDGEAGWELVNTYPYDLILSDVLLPKLDGIRLCQRLRQAKFGTPILLLTGQDKGSDKVMGLNAGADDYVVKPFDLEELLARIRVLLRRGATAAVMVLEWKQLQLNPTSCEVAYDGQPFRLTPKEFRLLELFLRNPTRVFSREDILAHLWSSTELPSEATVATHLAGLRQKLRATGMTEEVIETVYGIGYRLKALETQASLH